MPGGGGHFMAWSRSLVQNGGHILYWRGLTAHPTDLGCSVCQCDMEGWRQLTWITQQAAAECWLSTTRITAWLKKGTNLKTVNNRMETILEQSKHCK